MRRMIICIVLCVLCASNVAFSDSKEPDGFRGLTWGTNINKLKGFKYIRTDPSYGGIKMYIKDKDDLKIGGAKLSKIEYGFYKNKFQNVKIYTKGYNNWSNLKEATFEKFGIGYKSRYDEIYIWTKGSEWPDGISEMTLEYNEIRKEALLGLSSVEINKEMEEYKKSKSKEGAEKGF